MVLIGISIFLIVAALWIVFMYPYYEKKLGKGALKKWNYRLYLGQGAVFVSSGVTFLIILVLKSIDIL